MSKKKLCDKILFLRELLEKHSTLFFFICSLGFLSLFWFAILLPEVNAISSQHLHFDFLQYIGSGSPIGPRKIKWFKILAFSFAFCDLALMLALLRKKGQLARAAILLLLLCMYPTTLSMVSHMRYDRFSKIKIKNLPLVAYDEIFSKKPLLKTNISSFDGFYRYANNRFTHYKDYLKQKWGIQNQEKLQAYFFLNMVANMWGYGNRSEVGPGCVLINENTKFKQIDPEKITIHTYIRSNIGCCVDYANLLKFLLDKAGIKNRLAHLPGHVFNEAYFEEHCHNLDATTAVAFSRSWEEVSSASSQNIVATLFPQPNLIEQGNTTYSPAVGGLRFAEILWAFEKYDLKLTYSDKLPAHFK